VIGKVYEPEFGSIAARSGGIRDQIVNFPWSMSAVTQAGLFFKYLSLWLWPDTRAMSSIFAWTSGNMSRLDS